MANETTPALTQKQIEEKLKTKFQGITDANISILGHYMYNNPKKWKSDDENFLKDANTLMSDAFSSNMRPSNMLFGAVIAIIIIIVIAIIWWAISLFMNKNNKNILNDPSTVNNNFI